MQRVEKNEVMVLSLRTYYLHSRHPKLIFLRMHDGNYICFMVHSPWKHTIVFTTSSIYVDPFYYYFDIRYPLKRLILRPNIKRLE